jgi:Protein of unknown function (DUF2975)
MEIDMTDNVKLNEVGYGAMLGGTTAFIRALKIVWVVLGVLLAIGVGISIGADELDWANADWLEALAFVAYAIVVYALIHCIGMIVKSVQTGDPFTTENANRLRKLGWMFLVIGLFTWIGDSYDTVQGIEEPSARMKDYLIYISGLVHLLLNPALILASPLMFILARVFDAGIAMREDVEGTV